MGCSKTITRRISRTLEFGGGRGSLSSNRRVGDEATSREARLGKTIQMELVSGRKSDLVAENAQANGWGKPKAEKGKGIARA